MAVSQKRTKKSIPKRTSQGGNRPKTSSMNRYQKRSFKPDRGQGTR